MGRKRKTQKGEGGHSATAPASVSAPDSPHGKPFTVKVTISLCEENGKEYGPVISIVSKDSPVSLAELAWEIANGTFAAVDELLHKRADILLKTTAELHVSKETSPIFEPMKRHKAITDETDKKITDDDIPF
jgi:hypothetical protein